MGKETKNGNGKIIVKVLVRNDEKHIYEMCAVVTGCCRTGLFLELENGQKAFASFGRLEPGTKVFCSVIKKAREKWRVLVSIDGIYEETLTA